MISLNFNIMTARSGQNIQIVSTWNVSKDDSLGTCLSDLAKIETIDENQDQTTTCDNIADLVDLSKFLILEKSRDVPEDCMIRAATRNPILQLSLVVDVNKIEIFTGAGNLCSFWKMVHGTEVEEFAELATKIYRYDIGLPPLISCVELKLLSKMESVMLIGFQVKVLDGGDGKPQSRFNFGNVENLLSGSSVPLSEGARRALQFMKTSSGATPPPFGGFAAGSSSNGPPPSFEHFMNAFNKEMNLTERSPAAPVASDNEPKKLFNENSSLKQNGSLGLELKTYLDVRLKDMEERLRVYFDSGLQRALIEHNQKLDLILTLLQK